MVSPSLLCCGIPFYHNTTASSASTADPAILCLLHPRYLPISSTLIIWNPAALLRRFATTSLSPASSGPGPKWRAHYRYHRRRGGHQKHGALGPPCLWRAPAAPPHGRGYCPANSSEADHTVPLFQMGPDIIRPPRRISSDHGHRGLGGVMPILHTRGPGVLSLPHQAAYRLVHRYFAQGLPEILQCHPAGAQKARASE